MLTVPEPAISINPASSKRGTTISVTGSGFPANEAIEVTYDGDKGKETARSDSTGNWNTEFRIPSDAEIGEDAKVVATFSFGTGDDAVVYTDNELHSVPGQDITLGSDSVRSGDTLTISGTGFPAFQSVRVQFGSLDAKGLGVNTDADGDFPATSTLVPGLNPGTVLVRVTVDKISATKLMDVVTAPTTIPAATRFADLIEDGVLVRVFRFDSQTQTWSFFDPARPGLSTYTDTMSGQAVWVKVTAQADFEGGTLYPEWSNPALR
jgi:hypothetical protein